MARVLPTTKTQVSGHRFMRRRVEHGLIFGDVRMIHDPLASRRRAMIFGTVAALLICGVMGLFAWMHPNPDPGDAPILRGADGAIYVRVDDTVHPVTNLTSARLIAGAPAEPARVGDEALLAMGRGVPVGITTAPNVFAPADSEHEQWSVCTRGGDVTVIAGEAPDPLAAGEAVLAKADDREWVVTAEGRTLLPPPTTPEGRILRRGMGIDAATPRWTPPTQVLVAVRELPPYALPNPLPSMLKTSEGAWLLIDAHVQPITPAQADILASASAPRSAVESAVIAQYPDVDPPFALRLPKRVPEWIDPATRGVCAGPDGGGAALPKDGVDGAATAGAIRLSGSAVATHFAGLAAGAVGVDSGSGFHVVTTTGMRHLVPDEHTLETIGVERVDNVSWQIISLLPEGAKLTRELALTATY